MKRQITDIQVQKKHPSRRSIFLDGEFFCGINEKVAEKLRLEQGMEIDDKRLSEMLYEEELSKAKNYVYRLLSRRMYSNKEVRDKLKERGYPSKIIEEVISTLEHYGYIDDRAFAEGWVRSRMLMKPKGKFALQRELTQKGISNPIIDEALEQEFDESKELDIILDLAKRRIKSYSKDDAPTARRKLQNFLLRRGFDFEMIKQVVEQLIEESEE